MVTHPNASEAGSPRIKVFWKDGSVAPQDWVRKVCHEEKVASSKGVLTETKEARNNQCYQYQSVGGLPSHIGVRTNEKQVEGGVELPFLRDDGLERACRGCLPDFDQRHE